jgi:hypothetical protein
LRVDTRLRDAWHDATAPPKPADIPIGSRLTPILFSSVVGREEHHKGKVAVPETKTGEEGSAKRNIQRKHDHDPNRKDKKNHGGAGGKGKWNDLEDGSTDPDPVGGEDEE